MRQVCLFVLLALSLSSCTCNWLNLCGSGNEQPSRTPYIPALERVMVTYGDELAREKRLFHVSSCAFYDEYIEKVQLQLEGQGVHDVCSARDLIVYIVEGLLARINEDEQVSYDVHSFPFAPWNLIIDIEFECFWGEYIDQRMVGRIHMSDGIVHYYAKDALNPDTICFRQRCEPYEKAYRFSRFTTYRPWEKKPPSETGDSSFRDLETKTDKGSAIIR